MCTFVVEEERTCLPYPRSGSEIMCKRRMQHAYMRSKGDNAHVRPRANNCTLTFDPCALIGNRGP